MNVSNKALLQGAPSCGKQKTTTQSLIQGARLSRSSAKGRDRSYENVKPLKVFATVFVLRIQLRTHHEFPLTSLSS